jgi:hypothetical protein
MAYMTECDLSQAQFAMRALRFTSAHLWLKKWLATAEEDRYALVTKRWQDRIREWMESRPQAAAARKRASKAASAMAENGAKISGRRGRRHRSGGSIGNGNGNGIGKADAGDSDDDEMAGTNKQKEAASPSASASGRGSSSSPARPNSIPMANGSGSSLLPSAMSSPAAILAMSKSMGSMTPEERQRAASELRRRRLQSEFAAKQMPCIPGPMPSPPHPPPPQPPAPAPASTG